MAPSRRTPKRQFLAAVLVSGLLAFVFASCSAGPQEATAQEKGAAAKDTPAPPPSPVQPPEAVPEAEPKTFKDMAVAGLFFPAEAEALRTEIDGHLKRAELKVHGRLRALICPHAGYRYSGPIAAAGFKQLEGQDIRTVILLAPSHYARFEGAALPGVDAFRTPLGVVRLSPLLKKLAATPPFAVDPPARVGTPPWARQSAVRPEGDATPHTWEHSEEVMIPFLQAVLKNFRLIPAVLGQVKEADLAKAIGSHLDHQTLVLASSDLSHYHPYEEAQKLDRACVDAVCALDMEAMGRQEACGKGPILTVMHLAKANGWKPVLLDLRNSGDTAGDKGRVVGYAAIAFVEGNGSGQGAAAPKQGVAQEEGTLSAAERLALLKLARLSLTARVKRQELPDLDPAELPAAFREKKGCFVTLTKAGKLRGCIGHIFPTEPLFKATMDNAISAGLRDPRFLPVTADELREIHFEISVLTVPQELAFDTPEALLAKLRPNVDGVVLHIGRRSATYLPQVWEHFKKKEDFLSHLARKSGNAQEAWRGPGVKVLTYQVEAFEEKKTKE